MADEAIQIALRTKTPIFELRAQLAVARVRLALDGDAAKGDIEAALERASAILEQTGARSYKPFIIEERARLASASGDSGTAKRLRGEAIGLWNEMGAAGHAERLAS